MGAQELQQAVAPPPPAQAAPEAPATMPTSVDDYIPQDLIQTIDDFADAITGKPYEQPAHENSGHTPAYAALPFQHPAEFAAHAGMIPLNALHCAPDMLPQDSTRRSDMYSMQPPASPPMHLFMVEGDLVDMRHRIVGTLDLEPTTAIEVGRAWTPTQVRPHWAELEVPKGSRRTLVAAVAGLAADVNDSGSLRAVNNIDSLFTLAPPPGAATFGPDERTHIRSSVQAPTSYTRYLYRLATMFAASLWATQNGRRLWTVGQNLAGVQFVQHRGEYVQLVRNQAGGGLQRVGIVLPANTPDSGSILAMLRLAASPEMGLDTDGGRAMLPGMARNEVPCNIGGLTVYGQQIVVPNPGLFAPEQVWNAATMWAKQHGALEEFLSIVRTLAVLWTVPVAGRSPIFGSREFTLAAPPLALQSEIVLPLTDTSGQFSQAMEARMPNAKEFFVLGAVAAAVLGASLRQAVARCGMYATQLFNGSHDTGENTVSQFKAKNKMVPIIAHARDIMETVGWRGQLGQLLNTINPHFRSSGNIQGWWRDTMAEGVQWEEVAHSCTALPRESTLLAALATRGGVDEHRAGRWCRHVSHRQGPEVLSLVVPSRDAVSRAAAACLAGAQLGLAAMHVSNQRQVVVAARPLTSYRGVLAECAIPAPIYLAGIVAMEPVTMMPNAEACVLFNTYVEKERYRRWWLQAVTDEVPGEAAGGTNGMSATVVDSLRMWGSSAPVFQSREGREATRPTAAPNAADPEHFPALPPANRLPGSKKNRKKQGAAARMQALITGAQPATEEGEALPTAAPPAVQTATPASRVEGAVMPSSSADSAEADAAAALIADLIKKGFHPQTLKPFLQLHRRANMPLRADLHVVNAWLDDTLACEESGAVAMNSKQFWGAALEICSHAGWNAPTAQLSCRLFTLADELEAAGARAAASGGIPRRDHNPPPTWRQRDAHLMWVAFEGSAGSWVGKRHRVHDKIANGSAAGTLALRYMQAGRIEDWTMRAENVCRLLPNGPAQDEWRAAYAWWLYNRIIPSMRWFDDREFVGTPQGVEPTRRTTTPVRPPPDWGISTTALRQPRRMDARLETTQQLLDAAEEAAALMANGWHPDVEVAATVWSVFGGTAWQTNAIDPEVAAAMTAATATHGLPDKLTRDTTDAALTRPGVPGSPQTARGGSPAHAAVGEAPVHRSAASRGIGTAAGVLARAGAAVVGTPAVIRATAQTLAGRRDGDPQPAGLLTTMGNVRIEGLAAPSDAELDAPLEQTVDRARQTFSYGGSLG